MKLTNPSRRKTYEPREGSWRTGRERKEGDLTKVQAQTLRRDDRSIRQEERDMARLDKGHIAKADQRVLNQQENVPSGQIPK